MKSIENSVDTEDLHLSDTYVDLEEKMASIESTQGNTQHLEKESSSQKMTIEKIVSNNLPNGVHEKNENQSKCNGNINGYCDVVSDDEFQLVLESSSEDGESPSKKIDEETISAPQLVQEIETLLGITSSSVGTEEDMEKDMINMDGGEELNDKFEDDSANAENTSNVPQEIQDVFEEQGAISGKMDENNSGKNIKEAKNDTNKSSTVLECDSSNMNLVFDEVEIGPVDSVEVQSEVEKSIEDSTRTRHTSKDSGVEKRKLSEVKSTTEVNVEGKQLEKEVKSEVINESEAMAVDTEDAKISEPKSNSVKTEQSDYKSSISNSTESSEESVVEDTVKMECDEMKDSKVDKLAASSFDSLKSESEQLAVKKSDEAAMDIDPKNILVDDTIEAASSTLHSEGEPVRKRVIFKEENKTEIKRPKREENENNSTGSTSHVFKRRSSDPIEVEVKRTKLSNSVSVSQPLPEPNMEETSTGDTVKPEEESCLVKDVNVENGKTSVKLEEKKDKKCDEVCRTESDSGLVSSGEEKTKTTKSIAKRDVKKKIHVSGSQMKTNSAQLTEDKVQLNGGDSSPVIVPSGGDSAVALKKSSSTSSGCSISDETHSIETFDSEETIEKKTSSTKDPEVKVVNKNKEKIKVGSSSSSSSSGSDTDNSLKSESSKLDYLRKKDKVDHKQKSKTTIRASDKSQVDKVSSKSNETVKNDKSKIDGPSCSREIENSLMKNEHKTTITKSPFELLSKNAQQKKSGSGKLSNLDLAIESVVHKAKSDSERELPLMKKFHKDQLKKLTRTELEEAVVLKICEAVTDRSEIGQMRLRCQALEQNNELWRKKALQFEKQNRELEMVLKRFIAENAANKRDNQNKVVLPIKVTRSVGLQVVLASSMNGALISSRSRSNSESSQSSTTTKSSNQQQQQGVAKSKPVEIKTPKDQVRAQTFTPPVQPVPNLRTRGRQAKLVQGQSQPSSPTTSMQATSTSKVLPSTSPVKPIAPKTSAVAVPNKDLEVIDLTDKEEKAKSSPQTPVGGAIRVAATTQMCLIQTPASTPAQQMAYLLQKHGQRQQYLVTTTSASPPKAGGTVSQRQPPALAVPLFRAGGQMIPVQTSPQVGVRTTATTVTPPARQTSQPTIRVPPQVLHKHPAPLPAAPTVISKPSFKAPPPKAQLKIAKTVNGIMLSWSMTLTKDMAEMASYQLYAYQESSQPPTTNLWKKVGDVKALPLPMACTLTQFIDGHRYHFAVRAVDVHGRVGPFSPPSTIMLTK